MTFLWFFYALLVTELFYVALTLFIVLVAFLWLLRKYIKKVKCQCWIGLCLVLSGCALDNAQFRKVTAWGIWCTPAACGVGYWHSERGPGDKVISEQSAGPEDF